MLPPLLSTRYGNLTVNGSATLNKITGTKELVCKYSTQLNGGVVTVDCGSIVASEGGSNDDYSEYAGVELRAPGNAPRIRVTTEGTYMWWPVFVQSSLTVAGTKSRRVTTEQYSNRLLYCYETPTPMFGDIGEGVIANDGKCYIPLDAIFAQTITTIQYQVSLQKYGDGDCWVSERNGAYFIVEGTPGLSFGWEIKAKQRDYDQLRLEKNEEKFTVPAQTYGADAAEHIKEIKEERNNT